MKSFNTNRVTWATKATLNYKNNNILHTEIILGITRDYFTLWVK